MQRAWWNRGRGRGLTGSRPPLRLGVAVTIGSVALATAAIYPLKTVTPVVSLSAVYLPAVLVVSVYWGLWLGLGAALLSAAAFNFFHLPPVGRFTISDSRNWVALAAFVLIAAVVSTIADLARGRADEAELRRREAGLAANLAREFLVGMRTELALRSAAHRVAEAYDLPSAAIELGPAREPAARRDALALQDGSGRQVATLLVPSSLDAQTTESLRTRVIPALGALIAIALQRDAVQREAIETAALRRSDDLKTALLQATSHDLRTPITAILAAGHALSAETITPEERADLTAAVVEESERLSALIDKLLDLSRLQSGRAEPRREWVSLEDIVLAARDALPERVDVRIAIDPQLPAVQVDAAQLERAFANLLENAWQYSGGRAVSVHARQSGSRVIVRVVDQGPGISPAEQLRIFEPFYRGASPEQRRWTGSGLGLAIVKGFVEANNGTVSVDSLPGQGASFVISFPAGDDRASVAA